MAWQVLHLWVLNSVSMRRDPLAGAGAFVPREAPARMRNHQLSLSLRVGVFLGCGNCRLALAITSAVQHDSARDAWWFCPSSFGMLGVPRDFFGTGFGLFPPACSNATLTRSLRC